MPALFAIPELLPVIIGLLALLLYLGFSLLRGLFDLATGHWGIVGRVVDSSIGKALDWAWHQLDGLFRSAISPIVNLFHAPATNVDSFAKASVAAHVHHQQYSDWISGIHLITMENDTRALIRSDIAGLRSEIDNQLVPSINRELWNLGVAINRIDGLEIPALQSVIGTVQTQLGQAYRDLAGEQAQIVELGRELSAIPGFVDAKVAQGEQVAEGAARGYTDALGREAIQGLVSGNPALPLDLPLALQGVAAAAAAATTFVNECGEPMCSWWHSNSDPLSSLLSLFSVAELAALLVAAVEDPGGAARAGAAVADEFRSLGDDVLSLFGLQGV